MTLKKSLGVVMGGLLLAAAPAVWAHPGHGAMNGFGAGFAHPLSGIDHILAMLAVGLVAAQMGGRALWILPGLFVMALLGAAVAAGGGSLPMVEQGIAVSVLVLGLMVAGGSRLALPVAAVLVAVFGAFHGYAHGAELATSARTCAGFTLASMMLMAVGMGVGMLLREKRGVWKVVGGAVAACGVMLLLM